MNYLPPHEVSHPELVDDMVRSLLMGGDLPPVLVCGRQAYSGTHRLAAWAITGREPMTIEMTEQEVAEILAELNATLETVRFDKFEHLYNLRRNVCRN